MAVPNTGITGFGGQLQNFTDTLSVSGPNISTNVAAFTVTTGTVNVDAALKPKGSGGVAAAVSDSLDTGGNKRGSNHVDWQTSRSLASQVASGTLATISGGQSNQADGAYGTVVGGGSNRAQGSFSVVGGATCTASGVSSTVFGQSCTGTGDYSSNFGFANTTSGQGATAHGFALSVSGQNAAASGRANVANSQWSDARGAFSSTKSISGARVWAAGQIGDTGDSQVMDLMLSATTTNATPTVAATVNSAASATTVDVLGNSAMRAVVAIVTARSSTGDVASWKVEGTVKRGANAATTAVIGTPTSLSLGADASLSTATAVLVANTTRGSAEIQVTGVAATNLQWVCHYYSVSNGA